MPWCNAYTVRKKSPRVRRFSFAHKPSKGKKVAVVVRE